MGLASLAVQNVIAEKFIADGGASQRKAAAVFCPPAVPVRELGAVRGITVQGFEKGAVESLFAKISPAAAGRTNGTGVGTAPADEVLHLTFQCGIPPDNFRKDIRFHNQNKNTYFK
jgi:hypothetical protein